MWVAGSEVTDRYRADRWRGLLFLLAVLASKAIVDFASSGLENCLSYLLAALFVSRYLRVADAVRPVDREIGVLFLLAALAFVNRADTIQLYVPALLHATYRARALGGWRLGRAMVIATAPAMAWLLFSVVYYGFPSPNTAYAKVIATGYPIGWKMLRGVEYMLDSLRLDLASHLMLLATTWIAVRRRVAGELALLAGIGVYLAFTVASGAAATHMSGRFLALPFFIAAILLARSAPTPRFATGAMVGLTAVIIISPVSAIKFGTPLYRPYPSDIAAIDTKYYVFREGAALLNWRPRKRMPDHDWYHYGEKLRSRPERVFLGGANGGFAMGYAGYAAGPEKVFVDMVALTDPLLARLPAYRPRRPRLWKSGHFLRPVPPGYLESLESGNNVIRDPGLREYYGKLRIITRGPVWEWNRFKVIFYMNLGRYDHLLEAARREVASRPGAVLP